MRTLKDFRNPESGTYYILDGTSYDSGVELCQCGFLKHCACFDPEANLGFVEKILAACADENDWETRWNMRKDTATAFAMYQLSALGFLEHGSSIPGWASPAGVELLGLIREALAEEAVAATDG